MKVNTHVVYIGVQYYYESVQKLLQTNKSQNKRLYLLLRYMIDTTEQQQVPLKKRMIDIIV